MKTLLFSLAAILLLATSNAQISLTATSGTLSGTFTTMKGCFDAINAGTHKGDIVISLTGNTTETATASLNASGSGSASYSSISISPSGGAARSISGNFNGSILSLNGADYVTINGLNTGGNSLTIQNTYVSASAYTIYIYNDATYNTITKTSIKGSITGTGGNGVVTFGWASAGSGNDNNTISYCDISASGSNLPFILIGSVGTSGKTNSQNTITNCNLYDYLYAAGQDAAIQLWGYSDTWTITNNSIYQTATRNKTALTVCGIQINV